VTHSDAPSAASGPAAGSWGGDAPRGTEPTLARLVGATEGRPEGVPKRAGESDGCIRAMKVGNGGWHPDPAEQRQPVLR
jgi:hypothetical protein